MYSLVKKCPNVFKHAAANLSTLKKLPYFPRAILHFQLLWRQYPPKSYKLKQTAANANRYCSPSGLSAGGVCSTTTCAFCRLLRTILRINSNTVMPMPTKMYT